MLQLPGGLALSDFRKNRLLTLLQNVVPTVTDIQANYMHFVETDNALDSEAEAVLDSLLHTESLPEISGADTHTFLVIPRPGTISPWSSKASDIAHNCGLSDVRRIERGILYRVVSNDSLDEADWQAISAVLHDRMTEQEYATPLVTFDHGARPEPVQVIPIMEQGRAALEKINKERGLGFDDFDLDYYTSLFKVSQQLSIYADDNVL